jgi:ABC-type transporter lipoprotein component MlaA
MDFPGRHGQNEATPAGGNNKRINAQAMAARQRLIRVAGLLILATLVAGCAQTPQRPGQIYDPLEPANREIYGFSEELGAYVREPMARG